VSPFSALDFTYRFRLDHADLALRRQEVTAAVGPTNLRLSLNYVQIDAIANAPNLQKRKQLSAVIQAGLTRYWSVQIIGTRDFAPVAGTTVGQIVGSTETLNSGVALTYRDECVTLIGSVMQSGIRNGDVVPGTSLLFTVVFKNLGDVGTKVASF
jgi:LPS-assembly protein